MEPTQRRWLGAVVAWLALAEGWAAAVDEECTPASRGKKFAVGTCWAACENEFGSATSYAMEHTCSDDGCECCCTLHATVTVYEALERGVARHRVGDFAGAQDIYEAVTVGDPSNPDGWHLLGLVHHARHGELVGGGGGGDDAGSIEGSAEAQRLAGRAAEFVQKAWRLAPARLDIGTNAGEVLAALRGSS